MPNQKSQRKQARRGAAVIELAACLPVLMLLLFGSIEAANMMFLKQALTAAAYEAAREAVKPDGSTAVATQLAIDVVNSRGITGHTVTLNPSSVEGLLPGQIIAATVTAPSDANSTVPTGYQSKFDVHGVVVMMKE